nr:hypothetical protein [uncultured Bacillus sp.]
MTVRDSHERRKIFYEELKTLKDEEYINNLDYNRIKDAYHLYVQNLDKYRLMEKIEASLKASADSESNTMIKEHELSAQPETDPLKELIQRLKERQQQEAEATQKKQTNHHKSLGDSNWQISSSDGAQHGSMLGKSQETASPNNVHSKSAQKDAPTEPPSGAVLEKPTKFGTRPPKNAEQSRGKNITWGLILGVILLFIGGLVFGTSNWSSMNSLFKVILVSLVSIVFFSISFMADKYFKITKTAFAFLTLGSLFLPITFISISFFKLLGTWLSLYGEGKFVFAFISSLVCLSLYIYIAATYKHRLFVWFTYLTATLVAAFLLALTYLPRDFFYLGIMLYNAILLFGYYKLKNHEKFAIFTKELPIYIQLNLVVSTLLMLLFFENELFYSFNILLTAVLYIAMVFVNKSRHYHIVFTLLFVYGMYQLIENSVLQYFDYIGFALIGMLFLLFQKFTEKEPNMEKIFRFTSGIISFCAFIFISFQGLLLRSDEDSFVLLGAYLIIAANYLILANMVKLVIFRYLAPIFLMAASLQSYYVLLKGLNGKWIDIYLFAFASALFAVFYIHNDFKYFTVIKKSSFVISIGTMICTILFALFRGEISQGAFLLFAFGVISIITSQHTDNSRLKQTATWVNPVSWGLSIVTLFDYLNQTFAFYRNQIEITGHLALGGLLLLGVSYLWKKRNETTFEMNTFYTGAALYTLSMLMTPFEGNEHPYLTSCIYLVGIAIYLLLVYKTKKNILWVLVSIASLAFLNSWKDILKLYMDRQWLVLYSLLIPVILLAVSEFIGRKKQELKPYFFWTAHVYLVPAFLFSIFIIEYAGLHPAIQLAVLVTYIYSSLRQTKEWEIKLFLYAAFTVFPVILYQHFQYYQIEDVLTVDYLFLIVSGLITFVWSVANTIWKRRIDWYLVPQAVVGLLTFISFYHHEGMIHFLLFAVYTLITLFLLHKRNWTLFNLIPLFLVVPYMIQFLPSLEKWMQIGLALLIFFAHHLFGKWTYKELVTNNSKVEIDWYTITSAAYIIMLFVIIPGGEPLWMKLIPALIVVYYLFMLINRFSDITTQKIVKTLATISILLPYYTILLEFELNQYIETELYTLPFIVLTIFLSRRTWNDHKKVMNAMQTAVLLFITIILMIDALESNTIYDAIIIGVLSLTSIIGGMQARIKLYFLTGIAVLLLNVLLQTRPLWGSFPWWGYLVIAGLILISFAGFNERQKQKNDSDGQSFLQTKKKQFLRKFKDWD